jgi:uncharacterized protein YgiM (DUF1202 family)
MKYLRSILLAGLILSCCVLAADAYMRSVAEEGAKLYSLPAVDSEVLFDFTINTPVNVLKVEGDFSYVVDFNKLRGWVSTGVLSKKWILVVSGPKVNLRSGPGKGYAAVDKLYKGQFVEVLSQRGRWFEVKVVDPPDGPIGWIQQKLVWGW